MTNQNLEKAREWADSVSAGPAPDRAHAAADVIQSLPDQWVNAEKLREIIEGKEGRPPVTALPELVRDLLNLLAPKLPTLADMTQEERKACQWMQARYSGSDCDHVIVRVWQGRAALLRKDDGLTFDADHASITPLPLPKLQWPGSEVVEPPALPEGMRLADHPAAGRVVVSPYTSDGGVHRAYKLTDTNIYGARLTVVHADDLDFLDGVQ